MSVVLRQKLIFEPAKINIISHTTKQLRFFLDERQTDTAEREHSGIEDERGDITARSTIFESVIRVVKEVK